MNTTADVRFRFGRNWTNFLARANETSIQNATSCLVTLVGDLHGKSFLDVGCGSGIHSLAALRLGAERVFSFDYDRDSVAASQELRGRAARSSNWHIEQGSVLDDSYMRSLGKFDVVYAWGVLMHTGDLWRAMDLVTIPCSSLLAVAIYNDAGFSSRVWQFTKRTYSKSGPVIRPLILAGTFLATWGKIAAYNLLHLRPLEAVRQWRAYSENRGMSPWIDVVDWAGGYPFEVAKPEDVITFYSARGFRPLDSRIAGGRGINEFTFQKTSSTA